MWRGDMRMGRIFSRSTPMVARRVTPISARSSVCARLKATPLPGSSGLPLGVAREGVPAHAGTGEALDGEAQRGVGGAAA